MAETLQTKLIAQLFKFPRTGVYAVIDGASTPGLPDALPGPKAPEFCCLFTGDLAPDVLAASPWLVHLPGPKHPFVQWLVETNWGNPYGIFLGVPEAVGFKEVRRQMRTFLRVRSPKGTPVLFRYYDPRIFRTYLPTCNGEELNLVYGPVQWYAMPDKDPKTLLRIRNGGEKASVQKINVADPTASPEPRRT